MPICKLPRMLLCLALLFSPLARAEVRLAKIFSSHMVLQQEQPIVLWGWADAGEKITVTLAGQSRSETAGADGTWRVELPSMKADGKEYALSVSGKNTVQFTDVLLGEVWLCSGQSNMGRPVDEAAVKSADLPQIRLFNSSGDFPRKEGLDDTSDWLVCSHKSIMAAGDSLGPSKGRRAFSEVAFHFGAKLFQELNVPIGLIQANCGGSTAADWTPMPEIGAKLVEGEKIEKITHKAGLLYWVRMRGMIPIALRGVIWYQGEDDGRNPKYGDDLRHLIESWRALWNRPELPFFIAQIAPTTYAGGMLGVWEGELKIFGSVPNTGLAPSNDIYDGTPNKDFAERIDPAIGWPLAGSSNPHPTGRPLVARRLADIALVKTYGRPERTVFGPIYESQKISDGKVIISFKYAGGGLTTSDGKDPNWFELSDGKMEGGRLKYVKAQAKITGENTVDVSAPEIKEPKFVRFGWHALARFNLKNKDGLPAFPFRTDEQPNAAR